MNSPKSSDGHRCQRRDDDSGWWGAVLNWWILPTHFVLTLVLLLSVTYIQGRSFMVGNNSEFRSRDSRTLSFSQSDVNTLISLALTIIRSISNCALTLIGWRMAFISLEQNGITLNEAVSMTEYRIPAFKFWGQQKWKSSSVLITLWIIFIFGLPSQFVAPVLTGAINWIPDIDYSPFDAQIDLTTASPDAPQWTGHNIYLNNRYYEVLSASGIASLASPTNFQYNKTSDDLSYRVPSRRFIPSLVGTPKVPLNSRLETVVVPFFEIHSLNWVTSAEQIPNESKEMLEEIISKENVPSLTYGGHLQSDDGTEYLNPFSLGTDEGRLVVVNNDPWAPANNNSNVFEYPTPMIDNSQKWVVMASRFNADCSDASATFGPVSGILHYNTTGAGGHPGCFFFAQVNYKAAAMLCTDCRIVANGVVEASKMTSPTPDPLVANAISMMPEVLFYMKISNSSLAPTWQNIEGYTRGMLAIAYQASWNALMNEWIGSSMETTRISKPYPVLIAEVNRCRIGLWFGFNVCLTMSGILLAFLQRRCQNKTIRNPVLAALMLDTTALFHQDTTGLCNAISLRKEDKLLKMRLQKPNNHEQYVHSRIEIDTAEKIAQNRTPKKPWKKHLITEELELEDRHALL